MIALASSYRLVTRVSEAVVLETQEQYDRHGLDPSANPGAVPTIPEPGSAFLLLAGAGWLLRRRKAKA